jgi:flagellar assembly protein FliH
MFSSLQYRDIGNGSSDDFEQGAGGPFAAPAEKRRADVEMTETELATRIREERAQAAAQLEQKLRQEYEQKLVQARAPIAVALKEFSQQRDDYFGRVEAEVVQLALSIAAKILHREAQVDSMLVATLVRMAVEKMREDSNVTVRVSSGGGAAWKQFFAAVALPVHLEVVEDAQLTDHDCILETELGSANFGLDTQLKEVEQGFFDLLALRPTTR